MPSRNPLEEAQRRERLETYVQRAREALAATTGRQLSVYGKNLLIMLRAYVICCFLIDEQQIRVKWRTHEPVQHLFVKATQLLLGIHAALAAGAQESAFMLMRSLFEVRVNLGVLLAKDSGRRLRLFRNFLIVEKWCGIRNYRRLLKDKHITKAQFNRLFPPDKRRKILAAFRRVKVNYCPGSPWRHWAWLVLGSRPGHKKNRISFRVLCAELGLEADYIRLYSPFSSAVHGSPLAAGLLKDDQGLTPNPRINKMTSTTAAATIAYVREVVDLTLGFVRARGWKDYQLIFYENLLDLES